MKGKVKWYNRVKEYGFITGEDNKDYFVHASDIEGDIGLDEGIDVEFELAEGDRGMKAVKVKLASK